jgi:hypothetical protein
MSKGVIYPNEEIIIFYGKFVFAGQLRVDLIGICVCKDLGGVISHE